MKEDPQVAAFLRPFYEMSVLIKGSSYRTVCNVLPLFNELLQYLSLRKENGAHGIETGEGVSFAKKDIRKDYERTSELDLVATALDPRLKTIYIERNIYEAGLRYEAERA